VITLILVLVFVCVLNTVLIVLSTRVQRPDDEGEQ
jgi:hypothetical protein